MGRYTNVTQPGLHTYIQLHPSLGDTVTTPTVRCVYTATTQPGHPSQGEHSDHAHCTLCVHITLPVHVRPGTAFIRAVSNTARCGGPSCEPSFSATEHAVAPA